MFGLGSLLTLKALIIAADSILFIFFFQNIFSGKIRFDISCVCLADEILNLIFSEKYNKKMIKKKKKKNIVCYTI